MKVAQGSKEWQHYLAFMAFKSTVINVFQGGDSVQNNFPLHSISHSPWVPSSRKAEWKGKYTHENKHMGARDLPLKNPELEPRTLS